MAGMISKFLDKLRALLGKRFGRKKTLPAGDDWEERDVLVGTLRRKTQLNVSLACGFYHIPAVELKGSDSRIRYVAIYQSRRMFGREAGIRYYGRVKKCTLVRRCDIPEIHSEKTEPYYRFDIRKWRKLPRVLEAKEKGFVSILTSRYLLEHSREVPQLWTQSPEEFRLYDRLLDVLESPMLDKDPDRLTFESHGCRFEFGEGQILISRDGFVLSQHEIAEFRVLPYTVLQRMLHDIG